MFGKILNKPVTLDCIPCKPGTPTTVKRSREKNTKNNCVRSAIRFLVDRYINFPRDFSFFPSFLI